MISVCMATYNGEKYIREQIESILAEIGVEDELIISDDSSKDATVDIIKSIKDPRVHLFNNPGPHGVNGNFENALRRAKGEYIYLSDQDDVWLPGKVANTLPALKDNLCVVHNAIITDMELNPTGDFFESRNAAPGFIHNWIRNGYLGCAMAFRREVLDLALPIPEKLPVWHDIWIGALAQLKGKVAFLSFYGIKFRRHSSTTSISFKGSFPLLKMISYRFKLLPFLFKRIIRGKIDNNRN